MPEEEQRSSVWLTTLANLALLIAIFTIIFAAHRAIQSNKHVKAENTMTPDANVAQVNAPSETAAATDAEQVASPSNGTTAVNGTEQNDIKTEAVTGAVNEAITVADDSKETDEKTVAVEEAKAEKTELSEPAIVKKRTGLAKAAKSGSIYDRDPYTNGGPLDLDRRVPTTAKIDSNTYSEIQRPQMNSRGASQTYSGNYSDHSNPWNSGGHMDLDSDIVRKDYMQKSYSSSSEIIQKSPEPATK